MHWCPDSVPPLALYRCAARSLCLGPPIVQVNVLRCIAVIWSFKKKKKKDVQKEEKMDKGKRLEYLKDTLLVGIF